MCPHGGRGAHLDVATVEGRQVAVLVVALHHNHRVVMARENIVDQQTGHASVAILEGVDADVTVVKHGGQFDGGHFAFLLFGVVPLHQVGHQCRRFFGGGVLKTLAGNGDDRIGAGFVDARVDDVGRGGAIGQLVVEGVVFAEQRVVQLADECFRQGHVGVSRFFLNHFQTDVVGFHLFEVLHAGLVDHLAEEQQ